MTPRPAWRAALAVLAALAGLFLGTAQPASAHDELTSSSPEEHESFDRAPAEVLLTMSAEPMTFGTSVLVTDLDGIDHAGALEIRGHDVVVPLPELADGFYDVRWRVVSSDGHPITGVIPFSVGDVGDRPARVPSPGSTGTSTAATLPAQSAVPGTDDGGEPRLGRTVAVGAAGALGGVITATGLGLAVRAWRRLQRRSAHPTSHEEGTP